METLITTGDPFTVKRVHVQSLELDYDVCRLVLKACRLSGVTSMVYMVKSVYWSVDVVIEHRIDVLV